MKSACKNNGDGNHKVMWWWHQLTLAERGDWGCGNSGTGVFWRTVEDGGESLLLPVWRSVGSGFTGKGEMDFWVVRVVTWWPGNLHGMGAGWDGMGSDSTKSVCPDAPLALRDSAEAISSNCVIYHQQNFLRHSEYYIDLLILLLAYLLTLV